MRILGSWLGIGRGGYYVCVGGLGLDFGIGGKRGLGIVQIVRLGVHIGV